jgi:hypothetical protein
MSSYLPGQRIPDYEDNVNAFGPATVAGASPLWVNMANVDQLEVLIQGKNGSTVTGSAITLNQGKSNAGANTKALSFTTYFAETDAQNTSVSSVPTLTNATNSTFTTVATNSVAYTYRIPVKGAMLDVANGFNWLQVGAANATNTTLSIAYRAIQKYSGAAANNPNLKA